MQNTVPHREASSPKPKYGIYVEGGVAMEFDSGCTAWVYDIDHWGICGQGVDERRALSALHAQLSADSDLVIRERLQGDEKAFHRDYSPCTEPERRATLRILAAARGETISLIRQCDTEILDWDDAERVLPNFARWRTVRQLAWHIVDTESRYYLPAIGVEYRERLPDLIEELEASGSHARAVVTSLPIDVVSESENAGTWTSVKLLRRLAWHERGELVVLRRLIRRARRK